MLEATDTVNAPWHLIADDDPRSARLEVFTKIADAIEKLCRCLSSLLPTSAPRQPTMC